MKEYSNGMRNHGIASPRRQLVEFAGETTDLCFSDALIDQAIEEIVRKGDMELRIKALVAESGAGKSALRATVAQLVSVLMLAKSIHAGYEEEFRKQVRAIALPRVHDKLLQEFVDCALRLDSESEDELADCVSSEVLCSRREFIRQTFCCFA